MKRSLSRFRPRPRPRPRPRDLRRWCAAGAVLLLVWVGVGVTVQAARGRVPQAAQVTAQAKHIGALPRDAATRAQQIESLIDRVQRLSLDDRLDPDLLDAVGSAVADMSPGEQREFVKGLMPPGLEPMLRAFGAMDQTQRRQAIDQMDREFRRSGWLTDETDREAFGGLVETATRAFVEADDPEAQLDLLPTMQKILRAMQTR